MLLNTFVLGLLETLIGTLHGIPVAAGTRWIVTHTTFSREIRAGIVGLGLAVHALYAVAQVLAGPPIADG